MRNLHHRVKKHYHYHKHFIPHYFLIGVATIFATFFLYSLFPPKVAADQEKLYSLDEVIEVSVWGSVQADAIEVVSNYDTPLKAILEKGFYPWKKSLKIVPKDLFYPEETYQIMVKSKNWFGLTTEKKMLIKTKSLQTSKLLTEIPESGKLPVATSLKFNLGQNLSPKFIKFEANPPFAFTQKVENDSLIITPSQKLQQGQSYDLSVKLSSQTLQNPLLYSGNIAIIDPLLLTSSTPANGADNILKQTQINLVFNKPVDQGSLNESLKIEPNFEKSLSWTDPQTLQITPATALPTNTKFVLTLQDNLKGTDGSQLPQTQIINFTIAGPVKVVSFSPTGAAASTLTTIQVNFNQPVDHPSAESKFSLNPVVNGNFSWSGNSLLFKPAAALAAGSPYTVTIRAGIKSIGGEDSNQAFSSNFATTSERSKTIGYSVKGRPIVATYFGNGTKKILLVGTMHGNESNTGNMLTSYISYLRSNQNLISSDRTIILVPYSNPDGRATNNRFNANGVDLNRNWDLPDWQALTYWQNRSYPTGGGSAPFSEPESRALRDLVLAENPVASVTYHSNANLVLGDGIAQAFGDWYANQTGYIRSQGGDEESDVSALGYVITGTYEEWATKRGVKTLVVEFISQTANEYSRNFPALKGLLSYPF